MSAKPSRKEQSKKLATEDSITLITLLATLIPSALLVACLWMFGLSIYLISIVAIFLFFLLIYSIVTVRRRIQGQTRGLHNLIEAISIGDYSFRGLTQNNKGVYGDITAVINSLAQTLQRQRLQSEESQLLLKKVVDQIDVAIIAWNEREELQLINPAAKRILRAAETTHHETEPQSGSEIPESLNFVKEMKAGESVLKNLEFGNTRGQFRLFMERFISEGDTHSLLFLTNVSSILRHEEKRAWQNLVRVLSHEINNSLTPLKTLSETLTRQVIKREQDEQLKTEITDGMSIVSSRANALVEFVKSYQLVAKLPPPKKAPIHLSDLVKRVVGLFPDQNIVTEGEHLSIDVDATQFEQALINLVKNAVEANLSNAAEHPSEPIEISWATNAASLFLKIKDSGPGIQISDNLFTPFYTTKSEGSGIGLVLSKQVIEAHEGFLSLDNASHGSGCVATVQLPLD